MIWGRASVTASRVGVMYRHTFSEGQGNHANLLPLRFPLFLQGQLDFVARCLLVLFMLMPCYCDGCRLFDLWKSVKHRVRQLRNRIH